jgi:hypothetical protein
MHCLLYFILGLLCSSEVVLNGAFPRSTSDRVMMKKVTDLLLCLLEVLIKLVQLRSLPLREAFEHLQRPELIEHPPYGGLQLRIGRIVANPIINLTWTCIGMH